MLNMALQQLWSTMIAHRHAQIFVGVVVYIGAYKCMRLLTKFYGICMTLVQCVL